jgi:hypothetical protein
VDTASAAITYTDTHARQLRKNAEQLRTQADSLLIPQPVAERLHRHPTQPRGFGRETLRQLIANLSTVGV